MMFIVYWIIAIIIIGYFLIMIVTGIIYTPIYLWRQFRFWLRQDCGTIPMWINRMLRRWNNRQQMPNANNNFMTAITFTHGKCEVCGREFVGTTQDSEPCLFQVDISVNGKDKITRVVCKDCLSNIAGSTDVTNQRMDQSVISRTAGQFGKFFEKEKS